MEVLFTRDEALCKICGNRRGEWKKDIESQLTPHAILCWRNTDRTKWETDAWEIAKIFMGPGQTASSPADTDLMGLLQLVLNCQLFTGCISNRKPFEDVSSHVLILLHTIVETINAYMYMVEHTYFIWLP